ncbi:hypothetical protein [Aquimarina agarivorans]|uniref:hypothetical protein n=1 Tax=Aquimarina agarivorans TaxID=980584 RepID=UPI000248E6B1|nr:hypothetical protein [Aquimarina agarivorans]
MKKKLLHIASIVLFLAVFTPLVLNLLEFTKDTVVLYEVGEEDQNETKTELEINDVFFRNKVAPEHIQIVHLQINIIDHYLFRHSLFASEIIPPPPKFYI